MRPSVIYWAADGRGINGISPQQATDLALLMRRYYRWERGGRGVDPWQSGASGATRYDIPRVRVHGPPDGYGPGRATLPEAPTDLLHIDTVLTSLPLAWRQMYAWQWDEQIDRQTMLDRLAVTVEQYKREWRRARTTLYCRLYGL